MTLIGHARQRIRGGSARLPPVLDAAALGKVRESHACALTQALHGRTVVRGAAPLGRRWSRGGESCSCVPPKFRQIPTRLMPASTVVRDEIFPAVSGMDGCAGMSCSLTARAVGASLRPRGSRGSDGAERRKVVSFRSRAEQSLGSSRSEVHQWEVAVVHRDHAAPMVPAHVSPGSRAIPRSRIARSTPTRWGSSHGFKRWMDSVAPA